MKAPVVTGVGAVTPLGRDIRTTRDRLAAGACAIADVEAPEVPVRPLRSPAARIGTFTTEPEMPRSKARRLDRGSQYAVVAIRQCLADAGYDVKGREDDMGILLGSGSAGAGPLTDLERQMAVESPEAASPFLFPYTVANAPASLAAIELGVRGPNVTITQKDPAGLNAVFYARMLLADGRASALVAGGADEWNLTYHLAYERLHATRTQSTPGYALSEGCAVLLLEDEDSARERGARVLARLASIVSTGRPVSPHRRRTRATDVAETLGEALVDAGIEPDAVGRFDPRRVGLLHLSANGVPWMDEAERKAVELLFGPHPPPLRTIKHQIGENPVVGALQLALSALALGEDPSLGAAVVNVLGAGGNQITAVLTAP